ncbi:MAG: hypothetical protein BAJATHORv1_90046 [Candidatus Thorarchaeota archaeon]|nr:MAG: hypothetical protein BAJATHORv1_90046 [Candidatus Thorarchaeota archaeon]
MCSYYRTVLEDVKIPSISLKVCRVDDDRFLANTYLIESSSGLEILLKPWIVGAELANLARECSMDFLRTMYYLVDEIKVASYANITEVVPLAGALYYSIAEAFEEVYGETINRCFVGAKRVSTEDGWETNLAYENFEALTPESIIIVGDTIATGGTIIKILETTIRQRDDIQALVVFSIAGGVDGAVRLKEFADTIDIPLYVFFSNAIFGVEPNGTDMPWLSPHTISPATNLNLAKEVYGEWLGRNWCSVWDWGERAKQPTKHLEDLIERCDAVLSESTDPKTIQVLTTVKKEASNTLNDLHSTLVLK